jgi:hypothetical protein
MKLTLRRNTWILAGLLLASFWPATTHAQAETAPDEFKSPNTAPHVPAPPAKADFEGTFSLPNQVQCHGHKLPPGLYTIAVKTVGENKMITIQHDKSDTVLTVVRVSDTPTSGPSVVMMRHGPGPRTWTLEGVYIEKSKVSLYLDEGGHTNFLDRMFASVKRVPIS